MHPNFTLKKLGDVSLKIFAFALIFVLASQFSNAQTRQLESRKTTPQQEAQLQKEKLEKSNALQLNNSNGGYRYTGPAMLGPSPNISSASSVHSNNPNQINAPNPLSRAFIYTGGGPFQLRKHSLLNTVLTNVGSTVTFGFPAAMALDTTSGKLYVVDQEAPFALYYIDTVTGVRAFVANCTGVPQSFLTGITWDPRTKKMYGVSTDGGSVSQIFTINMTTGVCTPIGSPSPVSPLAIMINAAPGGTLFSIDLNDNLYKWNKTTGVPTLIGSTGLDVSFGQDGHFDFSDGQYYWAAIFATSTTSELRVIDTTTASSIQIGLYPAAVQASTLGIFSTDAVACAGTPIPGNTISSVPQACSGTPFVLSLTNFTQGSNVSYQWQSGTSSTGPWTNVGPNSHLYSPSLSASTWYRALVTCGALTGTSNPVQVNLAPQTNCYCLPASASDCSFDDAITNVKLATLNNSSACTTGGYADYTALAAPNVIAGGANPMSVTIAPGGNDNIAVWIDYNQNGIFDAAEYTNFGNTPGGTVTNNIIVPPTALLGITRMRVRVRYSTAITSGQACTGFVYGETEDYKVNIVPCVPIQITSVPVSTTLNCGAIASFTVTATGSLPVYSWQFRTSTTGSWQTITNGGPYSGATTATLTIDPAAVSMTGYQYRALVAGACSGVDFTSPPATLTVNPAVVTITPSPALVCQGGVTALTFNTVGTSLLINEGFEGTALPAGWNMQNLSSPIGSVPNWIFSSTASLSPAQNGTANSYAFAFFNNVAGNNTISNWLLTPAVNIKNGDVFSFWTRTSNPVDYADRLEVRLSTNGASTNVGATNTSVGDFTTVLATVNPNLTLIGYPSTWTQYSVTISGITGTVTGRMGFRYFVINGGPAGDNSDRIGIDNVRYSSSGTNPAAAVWTGPAGTIFTNPAGTIPYVANTPLSTVYVSPSVNSTYTASFPMGAACATTPVNIPVTVVTPLTAVTSPSNTSGCLGGSATFTTTGATGGPFTRQWEVSTNGGLTWTNIVGQTGATLTLTNLMQIMNNNLYRVTYTAAPCTGSVMSSSSAKLTVNPLPVVTISAPDLELTPGQTTVITGTSSPAAISWSWTLNGVAIAGTTNTQTVNINTLGAYQATVVDNQTPGCTAKSNILVIGSEISDRLWIYPNPTTGVFQARLYFRNGPSENRIVTIYNSIGVNVLTKEFSLTNVGTDYLQMNFNLSNMPRGVYVVKVAHELSGKIVSGLVLVQ
ncbi:MAG: choice-of-anchor J domain-containing protein [Chitinophagaceae bacterium]